MPELRLTRAATRDIEELRKESVVAFGREQTSAYLTGLRTALARLLEFPALGVRRDDLRRETRVLRYRSHRIYYRLTTGGILIQRVLHYARQVRREMIDDR